MNDRLAELRKARHLERQGRLLEAIQAYRAVLARWPKQPDSWYNLALLQRRAHCIADALTSYERAIELGAARAEEIYVNIGVIYADDLHRPEAAEAALQAALKLNPEYVPALLNFANLCEDRGRRNAAVALYEKILSRDPEHFLALARLANCCRVDDPQDAIIGRLRRALDHPHATVADQADLGFALGKALDACGEYSAAFEAYRAANGRSRQTAPPEAKPYDPLAQERLVDQLIAMTPASRAAHGPRIAPSTASPQPIFIVGMFRSGSTLVEQILGGHPRISAGGELDLLPRWLRERLQPFPESLRGLSMADLASAAARYLAELGALFPSADFVTDKRPDNFLLVGLIKALFPAAKIMHTRRAALDNCLAVFFLHLDQRMSYALDLAHIGHFYRQYERLMAHWKSLYPEDIFDVDYDAVVRNPESVIAALLDFLGLAWDQRCLNFAADGRVVKTASVWQVREPLHQRSSGRARHYERELASLRAYLDEGGANPAVGL
ncbi:MAG: tetratricopeptide repeat protein [Steroidobacteraceae bacterium]